MSTQKETGGPAFPSTNELIIGDIGTSGHAGMTLRDYFAAKAMQGMLSDLPKGFYGLEWKETTAQTAYQLSDAMLEARK